MWQSRRQKACLCSCQIVDTKMILPGRDLSALCSNCASRKRKNRMEIEAILELIVSFAFIDGKLHAKEAEVLRSICDEWDIPCQKLKSRIEEHKHKTEDRERVCHKAFEAIDSRYARERLVGYLINIATADGVHDQRELKFLNTIRERWSLNVSIGKLLTLDEDQRAVVQADHNKRMLVDAGPGMGKTEVACARVSELIKQNVTPNNIWMFSFTRAAVKEVRDRISSFSDHDLSPMGIKVTTIDSRAWKIRYGLTDGEIKNLFGNFDQNIEEAIALFDKKTDEMYENFCNTEHVIIDEAQDIMGSRAELLMRILKCLDSDCGLTIFADRAQAIYGFTDDQEDKEKGDTLSFLDYVKEEFKDSLQEKELKTIHRTNNSNLVNLIEELRLDIYVRDNVDEIHYGKRKHLIEKHADKKAGAFSSREIDGKDNTLVLFRRRAEVLHASNYACRDGVAHRIRMSGHPSGIFSWIGFVLCDYPEHTISKERFLEICKQKKDLFENYADLSTYEKWWSLLPSTGNGNNTVDVNRLRTTLSRNRPPINFCYPDTGNKGPILGTIHASKGREADNVVLRLPLSVRKMQDSNYDEESRVLYVGATRAKEELAVGEGFKSFARSLKSNRKYERRRSKDPQKYQLALIEIGLEGDIDEYSFVSQKRSLKEVVESQRKLSKLAKEPPFPLTALRDKYGNDYIYKIWTRSNGKEVDKIIGEFSASFNKELFEIAKSFGNFSSPQDIRRAPFYMLGLRTVCKSKNDPGLKVVHKPYSETGFWIVPTLIGYSCCLFPKQKEYR